MNYMSYFWTFQMVTVCKGHRFLLDEKMLIPNYSIIAFIILSITVWERRPYQMIRLSFAATREIS